MYQQANRWQARRWLAFRDGTAYTFSVLALTLFLSGIFAFQPVRPDHRAVQTVTRQTALTSDSAPDPETLAQRIVEQWRARKDSTASLQIHWIPESPAWTSARIEAIGDDPGELSEAVEWIGERLIRETRNWEQQTARRNQERAARWEVSETRHYERRARNALDRFLADQFVLLSTRPATTPTTPVAPAVRVELTRLEAELMRLKNERQLQAARLQPSHPQLVQLDYDIAQLELQIRNTSRYVTAPLSAATPQAPQIDLGNYRRLRSSYDRAVRTAEASEKRAQAELVQILQQASTPTTWQIEPLLVRQLPESGLPTGWLLGSLAFALIGGSLLVLAASHLSPITRPQTIPVLSLAETREVEPNPEPSADAVARGNWLRRLRIVGEVSLGCLIAVVVAALAVGNPLTMELLEQPLTTLNLAVHHWFGTV